MTKKLDIYAPPKTNLENKQVSREAQRGESIASRVMIVIAGIGAFFVGAAGIL